MEEIKLYQCIGKYKLSFTYYLAKKVKGPPYPLYCRTNYLRKGTNFRSQALPDRYNSMEDIIPYTSELEKEISMITKMVEKLPAREGLREISLAVQKYLSLVDHMSLKKKIIKLKKLHKDFCEVLEHGADPKSAMKIHNEKAAKILL